MKHKLYFFLYSYEMGGCVPNQLSLLHASLSSLHAHFQAQVLLASSTPHLAHLVRRITEETHKLTQDQDVRKHA